MSFKKINGVYSLALLVLVLAMVVFLNANAIADSPAPTGITISPAFQQISIQPDELEHPLQFKITNNETRLLTLSITAADFNTLNESGGLFFVGTNPTDIQKKYGLAKWIDIPTPTIALSPKQTVDIKASVLNQLDLSPGGHYGAIMVALANGGANSSALSKVAIHPIASSLLFINKIGGDIHSLRLANVTVAHRFFSSPSSVNIHFYNDGNTHLIPRGVVNVTSPSGKLVARGVINQDSNIILPETYRKYAVAINNLTSITRPGRYKLTIVYRYDGYNQFRTYQTSFWVIGGVLLTFVILIMASLAYFAYLWCFKPTVLHRFLLKNKAWLQKINRQA